MIRHFTFSFFSLLFALSCFGQADSLDRYQTGMSFYFDYGKLTSLLSKQNTKYEGGASVFFGKHWVFSGEYGYALLEPDKAYDDTYSSEGQYYRAGFDYKMSVNPTANLAIGFRYGSSRFSDRGIDATDSLSSGFSREGLTADWYEIVMETEAEWKPHIFLGWKLRVRILNSYTRFPEQEIYSIPGYGRTLDNSIPALNLFIKYKIPFTNPSRN